MTDWKRVQGSQETQPAEFDTTSSSVIVYQRKNIERVTVHDEMNDTDTEMWEYDEREMTREEYVLYAAENNKAHIDYIAMMSDIEFVEEE